MNDKQIIQSAYEDMMKKVFAIFWDNWIVAQTQGEKNAAKSRFVKGVTQIREARDTALGALP